MKEIAPFHQRFDEALNIRKMTLAEISKKTGIPPATLSDYHIGKSVPRITSVLLISKALDLNPVWLMGFNAPIFNDKDK